MTAFWRRARPHAAPPSSSRCGVLRIAPSTLRWRLLAALLATCVFYVSASVAGQATRQAATTVSFACSELACGMPALGAYPHFVVGRVAAVANAKQAKALFQDMREHGHWSALPSQGDLFWKNLQPIAIDAGHGAVIITLTSQDEMHAAPIEVGDYARYSPHRGKYETPPADKIAAAYWGVDGCVAILCRAGDHKCIKQYANGVFRVSDGVQLSTRSFIPLRHGAVIDTETMFPRHAGR